MMAADYWREREGRKTIQTNFGFVSYKVDGTACLICDMYVVPEYRKEKIGTELANQVVKEALSVGCEFLIAEVYLAAFNATESIKAILAYGFSLGSAEPGKIILFKHIKKGP